MLFCFLRKQFYMLSQLFSTYQILQSELPVNETINSVIYSDYCFWFHLYTSSITQYHLPYVSECLWLSFLLKTLYIDLMDTNKFFILIIPNLLDSPIDSIISYANLHLRFSDSTSCANILTEIYFEITVSTFALTTSSSYILTDL